MPICGGLSVFFQEMALLLFPVIFVVECLHSKQSESVEVIGCVNLSLKVLNEFLDGRY